MAEQTRIGLLYSSNANGVLLHLDLPKEWESAVCAYYGFNGQRSGSAPLERPNGGRSQLIAIGVVRRIRLPAIPNIRRSHLFLEIEHDQRLSFMIRGKPGPRGRAKRGRVQHHARASGEQGQVFDRPASDEQGQVFDRPASDEQGQVFDGPASDEQGQVFDGPASDEQGQVFDRPASDEQLDPGTPVPTDWLLAPEKSSLQWV